MLYMFCSTAIDLPSVYNSYYSVYIFQIDLREGAVPINNWLCFGNSIWVCMALITIYTTIMIELKKRTKEVEAGFKKAIGKRQKKVLLQSFCICFFLFMVALAYALAGFIPVPLTLTKFATVALQLCSGNVWGGREELI